MDRLHRCTQSLKLVPALKGRIDEYQATALRRRQKGFQGCVAVGVMHRDLPITGKGRLEQRIVARVQLGQQQPVTGAQQGAAQPGRTGVIAQRAIGIQRPHLVAIVA